MKKRYYQKVEIKKSHRGYEIFSPAKLHRSLQYAGLSRSRANRIVDEVKKNVSAGDSTKDIYRRAYSLVRRESFVAAVHYSLKNSLLQLGPTGFIFEVFVSKLFQEAGFEVKTGVTFQGLWVRHEVDVIVTKDGKRYFIECKFHNNSGHKNDIKVVLYIKARWDDLKQGPEGHNLAGYYVASNTSFTTDALKYAEGSGLELLGVNAPQGKSFIQIVEERKLYPITSLTRLKKNIRQQLLSRNIVLCKELLDNRLVLEQLGLDIDQINLLFKDIATLTVGKVET